MTDIGVFLRITLENQQIRYRGNIYSVDDLKVELYRKNPVKGYSFLIALIGIYLAVFVTIFTSPIYSILFDYMFFIYLAAWLLGTYLAYIIFSKYLLESAVVHLDDSTRFFLYNHGLNREMIRTILEKAKKIEYFTVSDASGQQDSRDRY